MSTSPSQWPHTLTSGPLAGRTFWSDKAYRIALGEARLRSHAKDAARDRLEGLLKAHDAASDIERRAVVARGEVDRLLNEAAALFADPASTA